MFVMFSFVMFYGVFLCDLLFLHVCVLFFVFDMIMLCCCGFVLGMFFVFVFQIVMF